MKVVETLGTTGFENLKLVERDIPKPGFGEVLVRWHATSLNYHDLMVANGSIPVPAGRIPMSDGAGEVVETGEGVQSWQTGDQVMSLFFPTWPEGRANTSRLKLISGESVDGYACEYSVVAESALTPMPKGYSYAEAATLPCAALTAWRAMVEDNGLKAGDKVLVEGTGGMSIFALQFAKAAGAYVYATSSSEDKIARLKELGADAVVNYREEEKWGKAIAKMSDGGVDQALDVGGDSTLRHSVDATRVGGHVSLIGILGGASAKLILPVLFFKHIQLHGVSVGSGEMQNDMVRAIENSGMKPVIDRSFALHEIADAFRYQESAAHFGKIVLEY